jgi:hypothetical protein
VGRYSPLAIGQRVEFVIGRNPRSDRACAQNVEMLAPIMSPARPELPERDEHAAFAATAF